jgi:ATP-dependent Lon protease
MTDDSNKPVQTGSGKHVQIPLLPLRDILVFPSTVVPLFVGREKSIQALEQAMSGSKEILLAAQKKAKTNDPKDADIFEVGTISTVLQLLRLPDGTVKVLVEGLKRARILQYTQTEEFFLVEAEELEESTAEGVENEALIRTVKMAFDNYVRLNKRIPPEMLLSIASIDNESKLADTLVAHLTNLKLQDKQQLLEQTNPAKRLEDLYGYIQSEIEIMRVEKKIRARVKRQMEKTQKEYYLNEQMQAIQKELGDKDDSRAEIQELENQIKETKLSKEAREKVMKELKKLKMMSPMSAEATVVRNYIDTVMSLPWEKYTSEIRDINYAAKVLNRDHYGLEKVKDRVLEYLSVRSLVENMKGPILCLHGPPGVGKTSLARSIAAATGRKFVRISLGGVRDEAEIRGHRRTYIGSMPGKILMSMRKAGSANPVMLLDEIDKLASDYRGDPASALLEVLDPEQNHTFNDHYLDLDFDLSKVLFMATANTLDTVPPALLDRMELIYLSGYTEDEKLAIATQYLIPKQLKDNGLDKFDVSFNNKAIKELTRYYTREAGVRNLEREISSVCRKVARKHMQKYDILPPAPADEKAERRASDVVPPPPPVAASASATAHDNDEAPAITGHEYKPIALPPNFTISETITDNSIRKYLGPHQFRIGLQNNQDEVGMATGLAWTKVGGDLLVTEVTITSGKGSLILTGKLGEVMQESARAAWTYVRSRSRFLGLNEEMYGTIDPHIHVPEGAIPKDGPSAGICMATALTSALTGRPVNKDVAMTGEITLRGRVLPIGGLKEKILAAHRGGIKKVIIPAENEKDLKDIPPKILKEVEIIPCEHMDKVLMHALVWNEQKDSDELFNKLKRSIETASDTEQLMVQH